MRVEVSEGIDPEEWAPLPDHDRVLVGGHTVWTGPFQSPLVVSQPNRWGVIERDFPDRPCLVEADPLVSGHLPLPDLVVGFVDRTHSPIDAPSGDRAGKALMERAARLGKQLTQIRGVRLAATPFARTLPLVTRRDPGEFISECGDRGVVGMRTLPGLAGGVAVSVHPDHEPEQLDHLLGAFRDLAGR